MKTSRRIGVPSASAIVVSVLLAALLVRPMRAHAWNSACSAGPGAACPTGPALIHMPWRAAAGDEHRQIFESALELAGVSERLRRPFALEVYTHSPDSIVPVGFLDATAVHYQERTAAEFAQLADYGFSLGDFAFGFTRCPPNALEADARTCHDYAEYVGPLNSSHFLPQAQRFYAHYHLVALEKAEECAIMRDAVGEHADTFAEFLDECVYSALAIEAHAQHYLQDAWSVGHMWERWGSPDLDDLPGATTGQKLWTGLLVALVSGLIHGAEEKLHFADALCSPDDDVYYKPSSGAKAHGVGDLYLHAVPQYGEQAAAMTRCVVAGVQDVLARAAVSDAAPALDPTGPSCFAQRATNGAMREGFGPIALLPGIVTTTITNWQAGDSSSAPPDVNERLEAELLELHLKLVHAAWDDPDGTEMASGGLGGIFCDDPDLQEDDALDHSMCTLPNSAYASVGLPVDYVDYPPPWTAEPAGLTADAGTALSRIFHRAQARDFCRTITRDMLDAMKQRAQSSDVGRQLCVEFARRHVEVVEPEDDDPNDGGGGDPSGGGSSSCGNGSGTPPTQEPSDPDEGGSGPEDPEPSEDAPLRPSLCELLVMGSAPKIELARDRYAPAIPDLAALTPDEIADRWCAEEEDPDDEDDDRDGDGTGDRTGGGDDCDDEDDDGRDDDDDVGDDGQGDRDGAGSASSAGDPHLMTLDGLAYDFHAEGEFVLVRDDRGDLEVQTRQSPVGASGLCRHVAFNTAVAMRAGARRLFFDAQRAGHVAIDGVEHALDTGEIMTLAPGYTLTKLPATSVAFEGFEVTWPDGSEVRVFNSLKFTHEPTLHVMMALSDARAGSVSGLLGNFDGDPDNDFLDRDGTPLVTFDAGEETPEVPPDQLYGAFAEAHRVTPGEALFDYPEGLDTSDYQRSGTPGLVTDSSAFSGAALADAEAACAGLADTTARDSCVLDVVCRSPRTPGSPDDVADLFAALAPPARALTVADVAMACPEREGLTANRARDGNCEYACPDGFADCDGNDENGCEADLSTEAGCAACRNLACLHELCTGSAACLQPVELIRRSWTSERRAEVGGVAGGRSANAYVTETLESSADATRSLPHNAGSVTQLDFGAQGTPWQAGCTNAGADRIERAGDRLYLYSRGRVASACGVTGAANSIISVADLDGHPLHQISIATDSSQLVRAVTADAQDRLYALLAPDGHAHAIGGAQVQYGAWVASYGSAGELRWITRLSSDLCSGAPRDVRGGDGIVYALGADCLFGLDPETGDVLHLAKLTVRGGEKLGLDAMGRVYVAGLEPDGARLPLPSAASHLAGFAPLQFESRGRVFVSQYTPELEHLWSTGVAYDVTASTGPHAAWFGDLAVAPDGTSYVLGVAGTRRVTAIENTPQGFVAALSAQGAQLGAATILGMDLERGAGLDLLPEAGALGNVVVAGAAEGRLFVNETTDYSMPANGTFVLFTIMPTSTGP